LRQICHQAGCCLLTHMRICFHARRTGLSLSRCVPVRCRSCSSVRAITRDVSRRSSKIERGVARAQLY
jgi:hypothetical protein